MAFLSSSFAATQRDPVELRTSQAKQDYLCALGGYSAASAVKALNLNRGGRKESAKGAEKSPRVYLNQEDRFDLINRTHKSPLVSLQDRRRAFSHSATLLFVR